MGNIIVCRPKHLPGRKLLKAAERAVQLNPDNQVPIHVTRALRGAPMTPRRIAVLTKKYWGGKGVRLTVGFLDSPAAELRKRILLHMNAWNKTANVEFVESNANPKVRIAREGGEDGGYWSYEGTDILQIPKTKATMNLEGFTMRTPESEFLRVVRHEAGHTLGFPHEHMRRALVARIDVDKALKYFKETEGWSAEEVREQVLTPLEDSSILGTAADPKSIMCYQLPGKIMKSGTPIIGGVDISKMDFAFVATIYPKP